MTHQVLWNCCFRSSENDRVPSTARAFLQGSRRGPSRYRMRIAPSPRGGSAGIGCRIWGRLKLTAVMIVTGILCTMMAACGGTSEQIGRAQALAFANAVNLRASDVPRMGMSVRGFQNHSKPPFDTCATHIRASDEVAAVESLRFVRSREQKQLRDDRVIVGKPPTAGGHSVVYVMHDPRIARDNVAAARGAGVPACVQAMSAKETLGLGSGGGPYKRGIRVASLPFPLAGIAGYGLRVQGTVPGTGSHDEKQRFPFYEDTFGFAVGPAEIVLHADGVAEPFPAAEERRLLSLLYTRARAHALP